MRSGPRYLYFFELLKLFASLEVSQFDKLRTNQIIAWCSKLDAHLVIKKRRLESRKPWRPAGTLLVLKMCWNSRNHRNCKMIFSKLHHDHHNNVRPLIRNSATAVFRSALTASWAFHQAFGQNGILNLNSFSLILKISSMNKEIPFFRSCGRYVDQKWHSWDLGCE